MRKVFAAALLVAGLTSPAAAWSAEALGRLFFTPAQRNVLDAGKYVSTQKVPVKPGPRTVRLDGVVTRSDADRTIWVNGSAYHGGSPDGVQVKTNPSTPASTSIRITGKTESRRVKVGQQLDLNSGRIDDNFTRQQPATDNAPAPVENTAPSPVVAKKSTSSEGEAAPVREAARGTKKIDGLRAAPNGDVPAAAR